MVLRDWLRFERQSSYLFRVIHILENNISLIRKIKFCSRELVKAFRSIDFLKTILEKYGLTELVNYIRNNVFADENSPTWYGDFGEVLCTAILRDCDNHIVPIYKLRFRDSHNWAMRLTDIFTFKIIDDNNIELYFSEVKTRTTKDINSAVDAYEKLKEDMNKINPEIIDFVIRRLYDSYRLREANILMNLLIDKINSTRYPIIFLVYERSQWRPNVLNKLESKFDPIDTPRLEVRVILILNLRQLILDSYYHARHPETLRGLLENERN